MEKVRKFFRVTVAVTIIITLCIASTCASIERASAYINSYSMEVFPVGLGVLGIDFSVNGTDTMSAIGAESITIYHAVGSKWIFAGSFTRNDEGMIATGTAHHGNTMLFNGISGEEYKVTVTIFAENSEGSDSRTRSFILTA